MDAAPPLDELEARKRLAQAKMELHRAEMALYYQEVTAPLRALRSKITALVSHPAVPIVLVGAVGFFLVRGRQPMVRKVAGWLMPLLLPPLRGLFVNRVRGWLSKGLQSRFQSRPSDG